MRKIDQLANRLLDGKTHLTSELEMIQGRFSASILIMRKGNYDGYFWNIDKHPTDVRGEWAYRFLGYGDSYVPNSPVCLDCGSTRVSKRDDRSSK